MTSRYPDNWTDIATASHTSARWRCQKCGMVCIQPGEETSGLSARRSGSANPDGTPSQPPAGRQSPREFDGSMYGMPSELPPTTAGERVAGAVGIVVKWRYSLGVDTSKGRAMPTRSGFEKTSA